MNVLITGASRGIGEALALEFSRSAEDSIYLLSRNAESLLEVRKKCVAENSDARIIPIPVDINRLEKEDLPSELEGVKLDILINNAGFLVNRKFEELESQDMIRMVQTNFLAPAFLIRKLLPNLKQAGKAHVVNIGSMGGYQGSAKYPGLSIYSASKAALASLTECLAEEFKEWNIAVNCLALGAVQTEMLEEAFPGFKAPVSPVEMAVYIADFARNGHWYFNGKILPVSMVN